MNVSAIQAMPKSAIIATIPERKIDVSGISVALTCAKTRMSAAAVSMIIWISGVTDIGSTPPPSAATVGLMSSTKPKTQIAATPARKMATLRFAKGFKHDLGRPAREASPRRRPPGAGTPRRPRGPCRGGS